MSGFKTYSYPGMGEWARQTMSYSQAIRVENRIVCSGQGKCPSMVIPSLPAFLVAYIPLSPIFPLSLPDSLRGWDRTSGEISGDIDAEVDQAFENVEANLRHAGGKGWSQVYRVVTYSTDLKATHDRIVANYRKWMPDHQPAWTEVGVARLGLDTMHVEVEVEALDPEGAAAAKAAAEAEAAEAK
ncbi:hypothetical protein DL771_009037 [Monosporascus sp. 5C6A]|nr:hypothetical protein DL771_009037 [Monosporascus sp. 5C6A]